MKYDERACKFNMDTGCVELLLRDGRMISIRTLLYLSCCAGSSSRKKDATFCFAVFSLSSSSLASLYCSQNFAFSDASCTYSASSFFGLGSLVMLFALKQAAAVRYAVSSARCCSSKTAEQSFCIPINNNQEGDSFCCHPLDCYLFFPRFGFLSDIYNLELVQNAGNC